jgi:tetratricopeptide (TPR) repeat protein
MVITFPFLLLLADFWPLRRIALRTEGANGAFFRQLRRLVVEKLPLFALVAASGWITVYAQHHGGALASASAMPLRFRFPNAVYAYARYIFLGIWPVRLAVFYPHPENTLAPWKPALAAGLLVVVSWLAWRWRNQKPYLLVGWLWYLGTLVPVIGIVQVGRQALADRYVYLPFIGLFVAVVWLLADAVPKPAARAILAPAACAALLYFGALTYWQTGFWRDSLTLFNRALEVTHNNYMAENNVGMVYSEAGQTDLAFAHFREAERIRPKFGLPHYNLGVCYRAKGDLPTAQKEFEAAIEYSVDPVELVQSHHNLGIVLYEQGELDEAKKELQAALALFPDKENSLLALGMVDFRQGNYALSIADFQKAYSLQRTPQAVFWIGRNREAQGDFKGAASAYEDALLMSPTFKEAHDRLEAIRSGQAMMFTK